VRHEEDGDDQADQDEDRVDDAPDQIACDVESLLAKPRPNRDRLEG